MKSIKEKAEEKYPMITGELQTYNEKFIEGANYVLEEIEKAYGKEGLVWVLELIEQLKK